MVATAVLALANASLLLDGAPPSIEVCRVSVSFDPGGAGVGGGIFGLPFSVEEAKTVLIPVPWEPTTSYKRGTVKGPDAILHASRQIDLFDHEHGRPYERGIALLDVDPDIVAWNTEACAAAEPIVAAGGVLGDDAKLTAALARTNELSAKLNDRVYSIAQTWLARDKVVGLLGGDHASPFGSIRAHAERWPGLGVLHLDAHADLRDAYEGFTFSHASIMHNVATRIPEVARIVQIGIRDFSEAERDFIDASKGRIVTFFDADIGRRELEGEPFAKIAREAIAKLPKQVYLSFDIDGLDPALCPNTGTPVPGGLSFRQLAALVAYVVESGRTIVGFDLCEVAPGPDDEEWNGNVGARVLYKMLGATLRTR